MNVLITGAWEYNHEDIDAVISLGHKVIVMQDETGDMPCAYSWAEAVICNGLFLNHPIELFTNLKYVQLTSAGFDRLPMDVVASKSITVHNAKGVYSIPISEFVIGGVLRFYKSSDLFNKQQRAHEWKKNRSLRELFGKNVLIIGCGDVGTECAKRFKSFGCRVIGVNRSIVSNSCFDAVFSLEALNDQISDADIVVLSIAYSSQTHYLMNESNLSLLKSNSLLVNVSRGLIIDTDALITHMPMIGGAILDVFEEEPLHDNSQLWDMKNVYISPHNSFVGENNNERLTQLILKNLRETE